MGYSNETLKGKMIEIYPEIEKNGIDVGIDFSNEKESFVIRFTKDHHELTTYLEKKDADECIDGIKCIHLGVQIGEFIKNFNR